MNKTDKASISVRKILCICLILIFIMGIGVMATNSKLTNVKIVLSSDYEMTVLTSKTKVADILEQNHITLSEDEVVIPDISSEITQNKTIKISKIDNLEQEVATQEETITTEQILQSYNSVVEKIIVEQVEIPYETITKEATSRGAERIAGTNAALTASTTLAKKVKGITPTVKKFNTSAYCSCAKCCRKNKRNNSLRCKSNIMVHNSSRKWLQTRNSNIYTSI